MASAKKPAAKGLALHLGLNSVTIRHGVTVSF